MKSLQDISLSRRANGQQLDWPRETGNTLAVSITLDFDEQMLASLPLGPGERERHMQIELACGFYANGWLSLAQGAAHGGAGSLLF